MKIHLIATGGAVMHNIALALQQNGHTVTGSDDEIYNPARDRLAAAGLLPAEYGWFPEKLTADLDCVILGMHARADNPELARAKEMGLNVVSYPEFMYHHARNKTRIVVTGSHGKTTTTSMIMHILRHAGRKFDYLVGAMLEGFDTMVQFSDAPIMVIEGDEYLASPVDRVPKMLLYKANIAISTGVAWDHINVFPTFENYTEQFSLLADSIEPNGTWIYYANDKYLKAIAKEKQRPLHLHAYRAFRSETVNGENFLLGKKGLRAPLGIFGKHNLENLRAAYLACKEVGVTDAEFFAAVSSFKGAAKRLQLLKKTEKAMAYLDFAHAPSKVKATVAAVKAQFPTKKLVACVELHTFSSLNLNFLPHYKATLEAADIALVLYSEHTLKMKKMPDLQPDVVAQHFAHPNLQVFTESASFKKALQTIGCQDKTLLLMTSGTFGGLDVKVLVEELL
jgi:UDP-N-acetylmuramate: L-alanyl-gamma-D-glutamyl-meso-diaminopimelate ligase